jgi:quercetin dioxygenase-like cupin family protein
VIKLQSTTFEFQQKNFSKADETQKTEKVTVDIIKLGDHKIKRLTYQPGWRWSKHMKPVAKTEMCQSTHFGVLLSGKMHVSMEDGTQHDINAGDVVLIPPGHEGWVIGDVDAVLLDIGDAM